MRRYTRREKQWPEDMPQAPLPPPMPRPGSVIGSIRVELHGHAIEVPIRQPGDVGNRRARSDVYVFDHEDGRVRQSLRAALLKVDADFPRTLSRKELLRLGR